MDAAMAAPAARMFKARMRIMSRPYCSTDARRGVLLEAVKLRLSCDTSDAP
jgi:hypothetical protein